MDKKEFRPSLRKIAADDLLSSNGLQWNVQDTTNSEQSGDSAENNDSNTTQIEHFVMINSIDRNPHKESRFSFQCTFASQGASYEKKPIYENNPTIPQSASEKEKGVLGPLNSHGWKNEQGELFGPYDPASPTEKLSDTI